MPTTTKSAAQAATDGHLPVMAVADPVSTSSGMTFSVKDACEAPATNLGFQTLTPMQLRELGCYIYLELELPEMKEGDAFLCAKFSSMSSKGFKSQKVLNLLGQEVDCITTYAKKDSRNVVSAVLTQSMLPISPDNPKRGTALEWTTRNLLAEVLIRTKGKGDEKSCVKRHTSGTEVSVESPTWRANCVKFPVLDCDSIKVSTLLERDNMKVMKVSGLPADTKIEIDVLAEFVLHNKVTETEPAAGSVTDRDADHTQFQTVSLCTTSTSKGEVAVAVLTKTQFNELAGELWEELRVTDKELFDTASETHGQATGQLNVSSDRDLEFANLSQTDENITIQMKAIAGIGRDCVRIESESCQKVVSPPRDCPEFFDLQINDVCQVGEGKIKFELNDESAEIDDANAARAGKGDYKFRYIVHFDQEPEVGVPGSMITESVKITTNTALNGQVVSFKGVGAAGIFKPFKPIYITVEPHVIRGSTEILCKPRHDHHMERPATITHTDNSAYVTTPELGCISIRKDGSSDSTWSLKPSVIANLHNLGGILTIGTGAGGGGGKFTITDLKSDDGSYVTYAVEPKTANWTNSNRSVTTTYNENVGIARRRSTIAVSMVRNLRVYSAARGSGANGEGDITMRQLNGHREARKGATDNALAGPFDTDVDLEGDDLAVVRSAYLTRWDPLAHSGKGGLSVPSFGEGAFNEGEPADTEALLGELEAQKPNFGFGQVAEEDWKPIVAQQEALRDVIYKTPAHHDDTAQVYFQMKPIDVEADSQHNAKAVTGIFGARGEGYVQMKLSAGDEMEPNGQEEWTTTDTALIQDTDKSGRIEVTVRWTPGIVPTEDGALMRICDDNELVDAVEDMHVLHAPDTLCLRHARHAADKDVIRLTKCLNDLVVEFGKLPESTRVTAEIYRLTTAAMSPLLEGIVAFTDTVDFDFEGIINGKIPRGRAPGDETFGSAEWFEGANAYLNARRAARELVVQCDVSKGTYECTMQVEAGSTYSSGLVLKADDSQVTGRPNLDVSGNPVVLNIAPNRADTNCDVALLLAPYIESSKIDECAHTVTVQVKNHNDLYTQARFTTGVLAAGSSLVAVDMKPEDTYEFTLRIPGDSDKMMLEAVLFEPNPDAKDSRLVSKIGDADALAELGVSDLEGYVQDAAATYENFWQAIVDAGNKVDPLSAFALLFGETVRLLSREELESIDAVGESDRRTTGAAAGSWSGMYSSAVSRAGIVMEKSHRYNLQTLGCPEVTNIQQTNKLDVDASDTADGMEMEVVISALPSGNAQTDVSVCSATQSDKLRDTQKDVDSLSLTFPAHDNAIVVADVTMTVTSWGSNGVADTKKLICGGKRKLNRFAPIGNHGHTHSYVSKKQHTSMLKGCVKASTDEDNKLVVDSLDVYARAAHPAGWNKVSMKAMSRLDATETISTTFNAVDRSGVDLDLLAGALEAARTIVEVEGNPLGTWKHVIRSNSDSSDIRLLQEALNILSYKIPVTGAYDEATIAAVTAFQTVNDVERDQAGVSAGADTLNALAAQLRALDDTSLVSEDIDSCVKTYEGEDMEKLAYGSKVPVTLCAEAAKFLDETCWYKDQDRTRTSRTVHAGCIDKIIRVDRCVLLTPGEVATNIDHYQFVHKQGKKNPHPLNEDYVRFYASTKKKSAIGYVSDKTKDSDADAGTDSTPEFQPVQEAGVEYSKDTRNAVHKAREHARISLAMVYDDQTIDGNKRGKMEAQRCKSIANKYDNDFWQMSGVTVTPKHDGKVDVSAVLTSTRENGIPFSELGFGMRALERGRVYVDSTQLGIRNYGITATTTADGVPVQKIPPSGKVLWPLNHQGNIAAGVTHLDAQGNTKKLEPTPYYSLEADDCVKTVTMLMQYNDATTGTALSTVGEVVEGTIEPEYMQTGTGEAGPKTEPVIAVYRDGVGSVTKYDREITAAASLFSQNNHYPRNHGTVDDDDKYRPHGYPFRTLTVLSAQSGTNTSAVDMDPGIERMCIEDVHQSSTVDVTFEFSHGYNFGVTQTYEEALNNDVGVHEQGTTYVMFDVHGNRQHTAIVENPGAQSSVETHKESKTATDDMSVEMYAELAAANYDGFSSDGEEEGEVVWKRFTRNSLDAARGQLVDAARTVATILANELGADKGKEFDAQWRQQAGDSIFKAIDTSLAKELAYQMHEPGNKYSNGDLIDAGENPMRPFRTATAYLGGRVARYASKYPLATDDGTPSGTNFEDLLLDLKNVDATFARLSDAEKADLQSVKVQRESGLPNFLTGTLSDYQPSSQNDYVPDPTVYFAEPKTHPVSMRASVVDGKIHLIVLLASTLGGGDHLVQVVVPAKALLRTQKKRTLEGDQLRKYVRKIVDRSDSKPAGNSSHTD